ncbi:acyltransferase [Dysgonomonas sp. HGC4]|uniref:acyltransferase n=3 Tax=Dysgonomonas sp. HGC4 TaxID=1658009 RepID=UPI001786AE5B|nr:acyltransferase [Dysgonomonas sp. HGC4]MBD8347154.1 acyltransferase [Dysgonomonas sp. HGC4]
MNANIKTRSSNIELLRLVLMLMIVMLHVFRLELHENINNTGLYITELLLTSLFFVGVNCFVFISGYFGVKFKSKTIVSLIIQALFYSLGILILVLLLGYKLEISDYIKAFFPISSSLTYGTWWFLTAYIALLFIAPLLNHSIEYFNRKQMTIILVGMLFLNCFSSFIFNNSYISGDGYSIYNFITIYVLARYINKYNIRIPKPFFLYLAASMLIFGITLLFNTQFGKMIEPGNRYNNPFLIIAAIGLFFTFKNMTISSNVINKLAPLSFGVYLIHNHYLIREILFEPAIKDFTDTYNNQYLLLIGILFLFSIIVFLICLGIEKIRQLICTPIVEKIERKISKYNLNI